MIIIGSLFLPYTVQFDVGSKTINDDQGTEKSFHHSHSQTNPQANPPPQSMANGLKLSLILPTLSSANTHQHSPSGSSTNVAKYGFTLGLPSQGLGRIRRSEDGNASANDSTKSVEEFFSRSGDASLSSSYTKPSGITDTKNILAENVNEKLGPNYIQPKSRVGKPIESSVIEPKKKSDEIGLSSLRINRSGTNLAGLAGHSKSPTPTTNSNPRAMSGLNRSTLSMSLNNGSSNSLIDPITEEDSTMDPFQDIDVDSDSNDWDNDFNDMINPRSTQQPKLAPFGGFSNPLLQHGISHQQNVFETAPWEVLFAAKGNGSLIKAVKLAADDNIIANRKWVGTLAMPSDCVPRSVIENIGKTLQKDYNCESVFPSDLTFLGHYKSFCKQVLWPTLHYEIPDNPKSKAFEDHSWAYYKSLNQIIADKIVQVYRKENNDSDPNHPDNMIWIHDYHLLLVPEMVRQQLPDARIGLFLHVSFPSSEVFRCLAQRKALLRGMLGANCISFQTEEYLRHFLQTCGRLLLADTNQFGITYNDKFTMVNTIPVGIDSKSLSDMINSPQVGEWRCKIRDRWNNQRLLVSRDKLDKLRGIKEKLLAYEKFLKSNPEYIETTVLIQICTGLSSDEHYTSEISAIVGRINSLADNISISQPVVLLQQDITFDQYLALQHEADAFIVSSMREGMNLTSHEFIIATSQRKSPLILSEFTGSSHLFSQSGNGALLINPWDTKHFAQVFKMALTMTPEEKLRRWSNCYEVVTRHDSKNWVKTCISSINEAWKFNHQRRVGNVKLLSPEVMQKFYDDNKTGKRLFFINIETASTITEFKPYFQNNSQVPISMKTSEMKNSDILEPQQIGKLLNNLFTDENNLVYICSHMTRASLDLLFKRHPNLGLIAENGGYIKVIGSNKWISLVEERELTNWMSQVKQLIEAKVERLPGSKIEVEDCTIIFYPGTSFFEDTNRSLDIMGDCIQHINDLFDNSEGIHASLISNNVVVQHNQLSKRALNFLVKYHNQESTNDFNVKEMNDSVTSTPTKERGAPFDFNIDAKISAMFISGGSTLIDETNYEYGNTMKSSGLDVLTVTALDQQVQSTGAKYAVSGRNELLSILSQVNV